MKLLITGVHLLLIDEEAEIKKGDYILEKELIINIFPNYLTDLDECSKIIAYYPLTKEAKELDLPLLPNPFKDVVGTNIQTRNFNKQVKNPYLTEEKEYQVWERAYVEGFNDGLSQFKQFSLEDVKKAIEMARSGSNGLVTLKDFLTPDYSEEEIIQSLSTRQSPKEFIPEYINANSFGSETNGYDSGNFILKTITNSEGKEEIQGTYKY